MWEKVDQSGSIWISIPKGQHFMFRGLYDTTIDSKGRTSMPARFRESLGGQNGASEHEGDSPEESFVLTTGIDRCLVVYPTPEWATF